MKKLVLIFILISFVTGCVKQPYRHNTKDEEAYKEDRRLCLFEATKYSGGYGFNGTQIEIAKRMDKCLMTDFGWFK